MKLRECNDWKALHLDGRTILKTDRPLYSKSTWEIALDTEVEPMKAKGHYKAI